MHSLRVRTVSGTPSTEVISAMKQIYYAHFEQRYKEMIEQCEAKFDAIIQELDNNKAQLLLVYHDSDGQSLLIGFAVLHQLHDQKIIEIGPMVFDSHWRKHGIQQFIQSTITQKFPNYEIILTLNSKNTKDFKLYSKRGSVVHSLTRDVHSDDRISLQ
jgi:hypothetical protein